MGTKTHWKKLTSTDYIGAYSLEPGKDMILTIKSVKNEIVTGPDGRKEQCTVMTFTEDTKPMILNVTNAKTIAKLYKTPYIEEWAGCKIQLFTDKVKAFGETVEALRIRPTVPAVPVATKCTDCDKDIEGFGGKTAEFMAEYTQGKYGKPLCADCATRRSELGKGEDVLK